MSLVMSPSSFFFFNDTATTEIYTLSLHDALPILFAMRALITLPACQPVRHLNAPRNSSPEMPAIGTFWAATDRKSTRLNSSHGYISYAVFCLKKKKES